MSAEPFQGDHEIVFQPHRSEIPTDQAGLTLRPMEDFSDDMEFWQLQQRNRAFFVRFGNAVDETPEATTHRRVEDNRTRFGIRKDGALMGMVEFKPIGDGTEAEVGIELAEDATGMGYASAAMDTATALMLRTKFKKLIAEVDTRNKPSLRLCQKVGFVAKPELEQRKWGIAVILEKTAPRSGSEHV